MSIAENLIAIHEKINQAAARVNRDPRDIRIVAVTKYVTADQTNEAIRAGITDIGENKVQDALRKFPLLECPPNGPPSNGPIVKHLIGTLQTNKVKYVIGEFDLIHSVDRLELVEEISRQAVKRNQTVKVLVQVNVSGETSKHGVSPDTLMPLLAAINEHRTLIPSGLMTMAPLEATSDETRRVFRKLNELYLEAGAKFGYASPWRYLSMGMSQDYPIAVEEGANLLRIGTAIFQ